MSLQQPYQAGQVDQVTVNQLHVIVNAKPAKPFPNQVRGSRSAHHSDDAVAFLQQELREVCAILAGYSRDQTGRHQAPRIKRSAPRPGNGAVRFVCNSSMLYEPVPDWRQVTLA